MSSRATINAADAPPRTSKDNFIRTLPKYVEWETPKYTQQEPEVEMRPAHTNALAPTKAVDTFGHRSSVEEGT
jgi:hypothetical protein